ncbi:MAG: efflux RND transporter periplasmic adaptor subunit [Planctomycetes bacterium]|nr:efflux RND transporter periplasmic adaptor subunit [Planctomycetota bacterium]
MSRSRSTPSLLLLIVCAAGCQQHALSEQVAEQAVAQPRPVHVTTAALRDWPSVVRVQGSLLGDEQATIGAKVAGRVREVKVDLGAAVQEGQVLALLDSEDFDLRVQQAEGQLTQVRASLGLKPEDPDSKLDPLKSPPVMQEIALLEETRLSVERARQLSRQNVITVAELDTAEAAFHVAEARFAAALNGVQEKIALLAMRRAELAMARQLQADAVIVSPFAGVVQERHVAPGVYLNVGQPVMTLVRTDPLRFRVGVPEREAIRIRHEQTVQIVIEGEPKPYTARVSRISPALDMSSRSLVIEADLSNPDGHLRCGLFAEGEILVGQDERTLAVPARAITEFAGVEKVWVVEDGKAREQQVDTRRRTADWVEIVGGLAPGAQIVSEADEGHAGPVEIVTSERPAVEEELAGH